MAKIIWRRHQRIDLNSNRRKGTAHLHKVIALRFSKQDIEALFHLAEVDVAKPKAAAPAKGGRPPIADWESAALEMACQYYRGDLKPETIADVKGALYRI